MKAVKFEATIKKLQVRQAEEGGQACMTLTLSMAEANRRALAVASGMGFLVLDRADVLSTKNRGALLAWLETLAGQLDSVLVLATSDVEVESTDWLDVRRLEAGVLST